MISTKLEYWKQEVINDTLNTLISVVNENIPTLRERNFSKLRDITTKRFMDKLDIEEEYRPKVPRLVKLTLDFMETELNRTNWYSFDDCWDNTKKHYGI